MTTKFPPHTGPSMSWTSLLLCLPRLPRLPHRPLHNLMLQDALPPTNSDTNHILLVRVGAPLERLQTRQSLEAQAVLRQHTADGSAQDLAATPLLHKALHTDFLQRARPRRVRAVQLLCPLLARRVQVRAVYRYHVVAAVGRGIEDGLMLAHQYQCD